MLGQRRVGTSYPGITSQVAIEECEDVYKEIPFLVDDEECEEIPKLECQEVCPSLISRPT